MKKKLLLGIFSLALLVATGYGVNQTMKSDSRLSDLALSNVEAPAYGEINPLCPNECRSGVVDVIVTFIIGSFRNITALIKFDK